MTIKQTRLLLFWPQELTWLTTPQLKLLWKTISTSTMSSQRRVMKKKMISRAKRASRLSQRICARPLEYSTQRPTGIRGSSNARSMAVVAHSPRVATCKFISENIPVTSHTPAHTALRCSLRAEFWADTSKMFTRAKKGRLPLKLHMTQERIQPRHIKLTQQMRTQPEAKSHLKDLKKTNNSRSDSSRTIHIKQKEPCELDKVLAHVFYLYTQP